MVCDCKNFLVDLFPDGVVEVIGKQQEAGVEEVGRKLYKKKKKRNQNGQSKARIFDKFY